LTWYSDGRCFEVGGREKVRTFGDWWWRSWQSKWRRKRNGVRERVGWLSGKFYVSEGILEGAKCMVVWCVWGRNFLGCEVEGVVRKWVSDNENVSVVRQVKEEKEHVVRSQSVQHGRKRVVWDWRGLNLDFVCKGAKKICICEGGCVGVSGFVEVRFCWGGAWRSVREKERLEWGYLVVSGGCYPGRCSGSMVSSLAVLKRSSEANPG